MAKATSKNCEEILKYNALNGGLSFQYNAFLEVVELCRPNEAPQPVRDIDVKELRSLLHRHPKYPFLELPLTMLYDAIEVTAYRNSYDPVRQWVNSLTWDGTPRVDDFYATYLGCPPSPQATAYGRYLWTALVGRATNPGIQADMMPIWIGPQGSGKSRSAAALVPQPSMFSSFHLGHNDKEAAMLFSGKLLLEVSELRGLQTREAGEIKDLLSCPIDTYRAPYARLPQAHPRRCLFVGTTNDKEFLADPTGSRRFLPLEVGTTQDIAGIHRDRDQLWAEAYQLFLKDGIAWQDAQRLAATHNDAFEVHDSWLLPIQQWLEGATGTDHPITTSAILQHGLGMTYDKHNIVSTKRVASVMKQIGYLPRNLREGAKVYRAWVKKVQ